MKKLEEYIRSIPDFPEKGIIFRDITTILQDAEGLKLAIDSMIETLKDVDFDVIVGTYRLPMQWANHLCHAVRRENCLVKQ